jgi:hypothetical protein
VEAAAQLTSAQVVTSASGSTAGSPRGMCAPHRPSLRRCRFGSPVRMDEAVVRVSFGSSATNRTRGLLTFRWDLLTNTAALHITQSGRGYDY